MANLISILKKNKIDQAFDRLGLEFENIFHPDKLAEETNPYQDYEWLVKQPPGFEVIINAVPPDDLMPDMPWEEWYIQDKALFHHILYLEEPPAYDEIFQAPDYDDIHPPRTLGKKWYVIDDQEMSPLLLREV